MAAFFSGGDNFLAHHRLPQANGLIILLQCYCHHRSPSSPLHATEKLLRTWGDPRRSLNARIRAEILYAYDYELESMTPRLLLNTDPNFAKFCIRIKDRVLPGAARRFKIYNIQRLDFVWSTKIEILTGALPIDFAMGERNPAANLPEELVVEILSWLPARSVCRFRCVSRSWRDLISHPAVRRRLAQPASGYFVQPRAADDDDDGAAAAPGSYWSFTALHPTVGSPPPPAFNPAFPFLPATYPRNRMELLDSCNGLLLLRCRRAAGHPPAPATAPFYVVCNPTTQEWLEIPLPPASSHATPPAAPAEPLLWPAAPPQWPLELPLWPDAAPPWPLELPLWPDAAPPWPLDLHDLDLGLHVQQPINPRRTLSATLAFDPAVSPHFSVVELVERDEDDLVAVGLRRKAPALEVYSSETGRWARGDSGLGIRCTGQPAAYLDGALHFATTDAGVVASVDARRGHRWTAARVFPAEHHDQARGGAGFVARSQGRLLYVHAGAGYAPELSVYALEKGGGGESAGRWALRHRARSLDVSGQVWFGRQHRVVAVHPDCNVVFLFDGRRKGLVAYDMDRGTTRVVAIVKDASDKPSFFPYIPLYK
ncbi:hypothetical protein ACP4OV_019918 [Aristida adscensionis]